MHHAWLTLGLLDTVSQGIPFYRWKFYFTHQESEFCDQQWSFSNSWYFVDSLFLDHLVLVSKHLHIQELYMFPTPLPHLPEEDDDNYDSNPIERQTYLRASELCFTDLIVPLVSWIALKLCLKQLPSFYDKPFNVMKLSVPFLCHFREGGKSQEIQVP